MRLATLALPLLLAFAVITISPRASAQASDADRAAARELFNKGVDLQNAQKFPEALDHFERSQRVVNAPTILLHIGQCQAALGHLVEAAEAFRSAVRFQLPANPPAPFVAAQNESTTQLATIEPRIPELKITVQPKDIPTLTVTVDDQPVNSALVGASRPTNPGSHKISATAPGYTKAERTVDIKEKQKLEVTLTLVSTGGVVYGPTGTGDTGNGVTIQPAGSASAAPTSSAPPPNMPPPPPPDTRSKMSIFLGARLGLDVPGGKLPNGDANDSETSMGDVAGVGGAIGIEGAFRFARIFFFSLMLQGSGYSGKDVTVLTSTSGTTATATTKPVSGLGAGKFGIMTNPDGVGFYGDLGVGYRVMDIKAASPDGTVNEDISYNGIDYMLGLGMHFKVANSIRIIPQADLTFGSFSPGSASTTVGGTTFTGNPVDSSQTSSHFFFFLGVGGYYDIDLDKPKAATPPMSSTPASSAPASTTTPATTTTAPSATPDSPKK